MPEGGFRALNLTGRDETASRQAYRALRLAIQRGDLTLGQLYSIGQIADQLNISRTPVREAVGQLEAESLVEILPQRGFRLRVISDSEAEEFFALREMLESYVVRTLIAKNDPSLVRPLLAIIERQQELIEDDERFIHFAEELHVALAECAGLPRVAWILNALRGQLWLLGTQSISQPNRRAHAIAEHRAIIRYIADGDTAQATQAIREHLANAAQAYRQQREASKASSGAVSKSPRPADRHQRYSPANTGPLPTAIRARR
jgi:DNA-binding GntR family transcriptional regulator